MAEIPDNFFAYKYKDKNNIAKLEEAVEYLIKHVGNESAKLLNTGLTAIHAYLFIGQVIAYETGNDDIYKTLEKHGYHEFLAEVTKYLYDMRDTTDYQAAQTIELDVSTYVEEIEENQGRILLFKLCTFKLNMIIARSVTFTRNFQTTCGLKAYFDFLDDDAFIRKNAGVSLVMWNEASSNLVEYIVLNLSALSRYCDDFKQMWLNLNAVAILTKTAKVTECAKLSCYTVLTNIVDDAQIDKLEGVESYAEMQVDRLKKFHDGIVNTTLSSRKMQVFENNTFYDVHVCYLVLQNNTTLSLWNLMNALYQLTRTNNMRDHVYFDLKAKDYLYEFLESKNVYEAKLTFRLFAQLSLNKRIALDMGNNNKYNSFINPDHEFAKQTYEFYTKVNKNISEAIHGVESLDKKETSSEILTWDNSKVNEWCTKRKLHPGIVDYVKNVDGKVLVQIHVISSLYVFFYFLSLNLLYFKGLKTSAPEFFNSFMSKLTNNNKPAIVAFSKELNALLKLK
jgi:hypothetical protein